jgi:hypothetical protein
MAKDHEDSHESDSTAARQREHQRRNELQAELVRQALERLRRSRQRSDAIRRGIQQRRKGSELATDR